MNAPALLHIERKEDISHTSSLVVANQEADVTFASKDVKRPLELEARLLDLCYSFRRKFSACTFIHRADLLSFGVCGDGEKTDVNCTRRFIQDANVSRKASQIYLKFSN